MKPIKLMSAVSASMVAGAFSTAFAADIYNTPSEPEVTYESPSEPRVNWSGPYAGVRLGYGHANHDLTVNEYFRDYCEVASTINQKQTDFIYPEENHFLYIIN